MFWVTPGRYYLVAHPLASARAVAILGEPGSPNEIPRDTRGADLLPGEHRCVASVAAGRAAGSGVERYRYFHFAAEPPSRQGQRCGFEQRTATA